LSPWITQSLEIFMAIHQLIAITSKTYLKNDASASENIATQKVKNLLEWLEIQPPIYMYFLLKWL